MKARITEYLDVDLGTEKWSCHRCEAEIGPASESYKKGCLVHERDPASLYPPTAERDVSAYSVAPDPEWCRVIEYYCPGCGTMMEVEYLPPGHPITHDIEIDLDRLREKQAVDAAAGRKA